MDSLTRLQQWYLSYCDDDWEHSWSVRIGTLDNPGSYLKVNLAGTSRDRQTMDRTSFGDSDIDNAWYECWTADNQFQATGGPLMLNSMIDLFLDWSNQE